MKIFVVPSVFPNKHNPVAGIFVYQQCKILQSLGHEIIVLDASSYGITNWFDKDCFRIHSEQKDNIQIYQLHFWGLMLSRLPRLTTALYQNRLNILYKKAIKKRGKPDLLFAHFSFTSGYIASKIAKKHNIPCIVQEHASLLLQTNHNFILQLVKKTIQNTTKFFCVSEHLKTAIISKCFKEANIDILHNPLDISFKFYPYSQTPNFVFFSAGNLYKSKNFSLLIKAFQKAFTGIENVELRIAGEGPEKSVLEELISQSTCKIHLLGALNNNQMRKEYINCNAFAMASNIETFGIVYREAMAIGRPVVAVKNQGILYQWNDAYGLLSEPTLDALATQLLKMYNTHQNFDSKKISELVLNAFGKDSYIAKLSDIIR